MVGTSDVLNMFMASYYKGLVGDLFLYARPVPIDVM